MSFAALLTGLEDKEQLRNFVNELPDAIIASLLSDHDEVVRNKVGNVVSDGKRLAAAQFLAAKDAANCDPPEPQRNPPAAKPLANTGNPEVQDDTPDVAEMFICVQALKVCNLRLEI